MPYLKIYSYQNYSYPSWLIKGFGIASIPSIGHIKTTDVPRQTTRPKALVSSKSLYGSSGSVKK